MKKFLSLALATIMFCAMTVSVCAAPTAPDRIVQGEIRNNAVLGGMWLEHDTFIPISTGKGDVYVTRDVKTGMTANIFHIFPTYSKTAMKLAANHGGNVVCAFDVRLPAGVTEAFVSFDVKEGYSLPENMSVVSMHGTYYNAPEFVKVNDRLFGIKLKASDDHIIIIDSADISAGTQETYKECLGWK
ncbi:hypothetical protein [Butyrivibrio sp. VCB2006]|uniref:hypothetical protein n=1 Tax=Butyrivibrio sp. VCB2006 TaxID=1280679 RepID=UPI0004004A76|nr:hypothetical protein [Butyrivibrio sp. VCB2006]